jgi:hypothetical protein
LSIIEKGRVNTRLLERSENFRLALLHAISENGIVTVPPAGTLTDLMHFPLTANCTATGLVNTIEFRVSVATSPDVFRAVVFSMRFAATCSTPDRMR